ncbi:molybdenum cofactor guanylyltransferase [Paenibacillus psychroresistens]|uniref:Molybdenum cofactor guanylyltransferase n=1 Tax=Paenibacillus psychroresistens TaxID=1778678 RepID=A0A6B8RU69_9BACL|nr:NTP transferase domain-containing protein [Paenibacillus psychroresistens]QGQ98718.1 molybdenum cofactor guanylyltransferase [Paenibacillus psychroresistens]
MITGLIVVDGAFKSKIFLEHTPWLQDQIKIMRTLCSEIIVVTQEPKPFYQVLDVGVRLITDCLPGKGPLSCLFAGFSLAQFHDVWVVNGEHPFLNVSAVEQLLDRKRSGYDAAIPMVNDVLYPLHGVYDRRCAAKALPLLNKGVTKVEALLQEIRWSSLSDVRLDANAIVS